MKERGNAYIIGVDSDWYLTAPDFKDIILTSVLKNMDKTTLEAIKQEMGVVPEGYNTQRSMLYLAEKLHISMPLAKGLWGVAHCRISPQNFINSFIRDFVN